MGVGAGLYMCDVVKKVHVTFAISSPDEFLSLLSEPIQEPASSTTTTIPDSEAMLSFYTVLR